MGKDWSGEYLSSPHPLTAHQSFSWAKSTGSRGQGSLIEADWRVQPARTQNKAEGRKLVLSVQGSNRE